MQYFPSAFQAELDYRRELMRRDSRPFLARRRSRRGERNPSVPSTGPTTGTSR
ncbi:MAG: hypothetical protein JWP74_38 [Marmoricola sp.]|nr:hypothetical protein [Marmoricola sp.]